MRAAALSVSVQTEKRARRHTADDLLFPDTHLIVDQTMALHSIAQSNKLPSHLLQEVLLKVALWRNGRLAEIDHCLGRVFLLLQNSEPAGIEVVPELDALPM